MAVEGKSLAFVHIDTSFLAYGKDGEEGNKHMEFYFRDYRWTDEYVLGEIEELLEDNQDATFKIAVGHHPIGHLCGGSSSLSKVEPLLQKYGF